MKMKSKVSSRMVKFLIGTVFLIGIGISSIHVAFAEQDISTLLHQWFDQKKIEAVSTLQTTVGSEKDVQMIRLKEHLQGVAISIISGSSMEPTYQDGSVVISNTILFEPELQDIVIYSDNNGFDVIKRVIGTPGDTVEILQGTVLVNGVALEEGYTLGAADSMPMVKLAPDAYFLIGDHRTPGESYDSRSEEIGAIPLDAIKGEVLFSIN